MSARKVSTQSTVRGATPVTSLSVDIGNAYSNLKADNGISDDWRSVQGVVGSASRLGALPFDSAIQHDGAIRVFGQAAITHTSHIEDYPTTDRYTSKFYKRLFAFALHRTYGLRFSESPFYPKIIASIPAREFAIDARVQQVRANLIGPYMIGNMQQTCLQVEVLSDNLTIIPEGAGAFYAMVQSTNNHPSEYGTWLVLDLGYLTADMVGFRDSEYMPDLATSSAELGIRFIADRISKFVRANGGPTLDPSHYDPQLQCDSININGRVYEIKSARALAATELAERINRFVARVSSDQAITGVILAGGGADLIRPYIQLEGLPIPIIATNARRANVEGAYLMLRDAITK